MRARRLIDGASFGPEAVKAIGEAFDRAWADIADHFGCDPADIDEARYKLATALLAIATEDSRDVGALKTGALQRMALDYRDTTTTYHELKRHAETDH
jgi:hypothetical protein